MAEVREELVARDGLTNSTIQLGGIEMIPGGGAATFRFDFIDEADHVVGSYAVNVPPQPSETVDAMVSEAYRQMRDILRQWVYVMDMHHRSLEKRAAQSTPPAGT